MKWENSWNLGCLSLSDGPLAVGKRAQDCYQWVLMMAAHATVDPGDLWHVAVAPGDTKILSLEQLDDLFRLDIIDASTRIWQPGMNDWLPLSVVAGLDAPAPPPPPSARRPVAPPPPPAPQRTALHAVPSAPPPAPQRNTAYAQTVPVANAWPPMSTPSPSFAPASPSFAPAPIESFRPMVLSGRAMSPPKSGGAAGRFVLVLALLAGTAVSLYRNGVVRQAALSAGQEAKYLQLETALGGPGFGTPRAIQVLSATSLNEASMSALSATSSSKSTHTSSNDSTSKPSTSDAAAPSTATREPPEPAAAAPAEPVKPAVTTASLTTSTLTSTVAKSSTEPRRSAVRAEPRPAAARPASRSSDSGPASKGLGFKGSSNSYDPLNGKL
jgi:hypothetical protein